jgi:hypothetical protein
MVIFAGACEFAVAFLINRTRKLFPVVVSGVVIIAVGLELGKIGSSVLLVHAAAHRKKHGIVRDCAFTLTAMSEWMRGNARWRLAGQSEVEIWLSRYRISRPERLSLSKEACRRVLAM